MSETTTMPPEGATAVTAVDVLAQSTPERMEKVELWAIESASGKTVTVMVRPENGESGKLQQSPLDGSFIGLIFEFHGGDKNEVTGRQFFPIGPGMFNYAIAYHTMPHYKEGNSPAAIEMKRRAKLTEDKIAAKAALLAHGLDEDE